NRDRKTFIRLMADTIRRYRLYLYAYCLMDNHYHLFLQTSLPNLGRAMQSLQGQYAHYFNLRHTRIGPLFQGRYKSNLVETDMYALGLARYIHRNPLEAGVVQSLDDYSWSSYPSYLAKFPAGDWLTTDWLLRQLDLDMHKARE